MNAEPGAPDQPDRDGADERNAHPGEADETRGRDILDRSDRHEAHDDMRLPEIAEPPGRGRDNGECAGASEQAEHVRIDVEIGRASCRARVCQYVLISVVAAAITKTSKKLTKE